MVQREPKRAIYRASTGISDLAKVPKVTRSFNAGELSPLMDSRTDQAKYDSGAKTMENFIPLIYGAAERRPGTEYIATQKSSSAKGRLVAFEHSVDDTYILLFENQVLRFFKSGAQIFGPFGTEDLSGIGSIVAHWKLNDNLGTTVVIDADGATHNGVASANTNTLSTTDESGTANKAFDMQGGTEYVTVGDDGDFSFGNGSVDSPFSVAAWIKYTDTGANQQIISKFHNGNNQLEWKFEVVSDSLSFSIADESESAVVGADADVTLDANWHFVVATYSGNGSWTGITLYIDWVKQNVSFVGGGTYTAMESLGADVIIGGREAGTLELWEGDLNNIAIFNKELSATEVASLTGNDSTDVYEITTPYLTADLPALKFEQSADVMFITHPNYEPRRLSRLADTSWRIEEADLRTGPFRDQNTDTAKTITASATTGSVTLTAAGHSPFVAGTTAGHLPSGSIATSKSLTGALFKLVQGLSAGAQHVSGLLAVGVADVSTSTLSITKGTTWDLTTNGTWGTAADPATIDLERSYDNETTYETVTSFTSAANFNIVTSETEEVDDALYRLTVKDAGGASNMAFNLSVRGTGHVGIVEITAVASPQSATATVLKTLASTDPTHRFSEGSFSNRRGWPIDVAISSEERLTFAGNVSEPLTTWGSVIGDFTNFALGTNDDDGIQFTLIGTGQQNRIRWMLAKETLVLGTVGGEHLLGASKDEEALSPTNVKAKIQTTHGSEDIAAILINQATLFVQRGGKKIREFLYNFEADSHRADDLTVFSNRITGDGIVDMVFQRTPDPTLWCIRTDGQIAVLTYERDQNVFSWYRLVTNTNLAGTATASVIESAAVIFGGARSEDEVWVTVLRQISGSDARYVERFRPRLLPSSQSDYRFLDSSITDTGGDTTIEGLTHLIGQTVQVLGDGLVQATKIVNGSGVITAATTAAKYQVGLGYDS
ncbi:MAG TPA: hypothetical protein ENI05_01850, partial [Porticoccus sp.]|nr:hypothetical protein [Porticoccus sp.]